MHKLLKLSGVLSWVNLIAGSLFVIGGLMAAMISPYIVILLIAVVLPGAIILHSYAGLQLRKSIRNPGIPLSNQTPTGIRLMGFMALFFAIMGITNGIYILQNTPELVKQVKLPPEAKNMNVVAILRASGIFTLVVSFSIATNVILNFRLLKWYMLTKDSEEEKNRDGRGV